MSELSRDLVDLAADCDIHAADSDEKELRAFVDFLSGLLGRLADRAAALEAAPRPREPAPRPVSGSIAEASARSFAEIERRHLGHG